jgi:DNA-binding NarL/FixJ family response regulator
VNQASDPASPTARYRVLLVEDGPEVRNHLARAISDHPALELLAACADLRSARAVLRNAVPEVLLTDLALPDGDGVTLIRELKRSTPSCECMVISVFGTEVRVVAALEAGATGYLLKDEPVERVAQAVLDLVHGGSPMSPGIARHVLNRMLGAAPTESTGNTLTERELTVLNALSRGFTYSEVAEQLGLSSHTVGTHVKHIYRKLEVCSRSEAVFEAAQLGLIRLS